MAVNIFELFGTIGADDKPALTSIDNVVQSAKNAESKMSKGLTNMGSWMTSVGTKMTAGITAPFIALGTIATKKINEVSAKIQALDSQFTQTFKDNGPQALELINEQVQDQGIHVDRLRGTWSSFYGTFKGGGADANQALDLTNQYMNLAGDGAAYYDMRLEEVTSRLKSLTMGNFEAGDAIGININATKMDIKAKEQYGKAWNDLTDTEKNYLMIDTVSKIYEASGAMGQGAREAHSYENVMGNLEATWSRFIATTGKPILDRSIGALEKVTQLINILQTHVERLDFSKIDALINGIFKGMGINIEGIGDGFGKLVDKINSMDDSTLTMIGSLTTLVVSLGPALIGFGQLTSTVGGVMGTFDKFGAVVSGVGDLAVSKISSIGQLSSSLGQFANGAKGQFSSVLRTIQTFGSGSNEVFRNLMPDSVLSKLDGFAAKISGLKDIGFEKISSGFDGIKNKVSGIGEAFGNTGIGQKIQGFVGDIQGIGAKLAPGFEKISQGGSEVVSKTGEVLQGIMGKTLGALQNVMGLALKLVGPAALIGVLLAGMGLAQGQFGAELDKFFNIAITKGPEIINGFVQGILSKIPDLISSGTTLMTNLLNAIIVNLPVIVQGATQIITALINGVVTALPQLIPLGIHLIGTIIQSIITNLPTLLMVGLQLLMGLLQGIIQNLPLIMDTVMQIIQSLMTFFTQNLPQILQMGIEILMTLIQGIFQMIPQLIPVILELVNVLIQAIITNLPTIIDGGLKLLNALIEGILDNLPLIITAAIKLIMALFQGILNNLPTIIEAGIKLIGALIAGLIQAIPQIVAALPEIISAIKNGFTKIDWGKIGSDLIKGIAAGITGAAGFIKDAAHDAIEGAKNWIKDKLGINSPSKVWQDDIGQWLMPGVAEGINDTAPQLQSKLDDVANDLAFNPRLDGVDFSDPRTAINSMSNGITSADQNSLQLQQITNLLSMILEKDSKIVLDGGQLVGGIKSKMSNALEEMNRSSASKKGLIGGIG